MIHFYIQSFIKNIIKLVYTAISKNEVYPYQTKKEQKCSKDRKYSQLTHVFSEQYKTLKNSEKCRFHKRSRDMHAQLSLYEEVHKCDLKFYIAHENVLCVQVKIIII